MTFFGPLSWGIRKGLTWPKYDDDDTDDDDDDDDDLSGQSKYLQTLWVLLRE